MTRAALALLLALAACSSGHADPAVAVTAAPAVRTPAPTPAAAPRAPTAFVGVVTTTDAIDVAPTVEAALIDVAVHPGDEVSAGQVLAKLDPRAVRHDLAVAQAALAQAIAARRAADVDVKDAARVLAAEGRAFSAGVSAGRAVDDARANRERSQAARGRADAAVQEARAQVAALDVLLADTSIRAPFAGVVAQRYREVGDTVGPRSPVVRLNKRGGLRLRFAVPPDVARALHLGQRVVAQLDTVAAPVTATIDRIPPDLDVPSRLVFVDALLELGAGPAPLQPGLAAHVRLADGKS